MTKKYNHGDAKNQCQRREIGVSGLACIGSSLALCFLLMLSACENSKTVGDVGVSSDGKEGKPIPLFPADYVSESEYVAFRPLDRPPTEAETRFEIVADSGLDFVNILNRNHVQRVIELGAGVALGDYDSDGNVDVYLLSTDGPNKLFRGLGDFQFEDVTHSAGVDGSVGGKDVWGNGASFADIDDDGDLDLLVCNLAAKNLLYVNEGDGTFSEQSESRGLSHPGASKIGSFCDYDRDGDLDLYLLTYLDEEPTTGKTMRMKDGSVRVHPDSAEELDFIDGHMIILGERDILYQNDGTGHFKNVSKAAGIDGLDMGLSATWFDFDGDDWQDLYVANDFYGADKLYRNNRDGTFSDVIASATSHTPWFSMGSSAGDLNNDGTEDLMIADMSGSNHYKQKVNMGEMSAASWFLNYGRPRQYMRNVLFFNTGVGRFLESAYMSHVDSTDWTWAVRFADLDNDGLQDIFITNGHARDTSSDIAAELKTLKEKSREKYVAMQQNVPPINSANLAYRNKGDFDFESVGPAWNLDLVGVSHGVAFADFDRDGDLDMVVNNLNEQATLYRNQSAGNRVVIELRSPSGNYFGYGAKVEIWTEDGFQMRRLVPVAGYLSSDEPILHFGLNAADTIDRMLITWPDGEVQELADLPANRSYRIAKNSTAKTGPEEQPQPAMFEEVAESIGLNFHAIENEYDDYQNEPLLPYQLSRLGPGTCWGDVNGDGLADVWIGAPSQQPGRMLVSDGSGNFSPLAGPWEQDQRCEDMGAIFFDADDDNDLDLYVVSGGNEFATDDEAYRDRLYLNDGSGAFAKASDDVLPETTDSGSCVAAADFDRDGDLDLFVGSRSIPGKYALTPNSRLLINENGKFTLATGDLTKNLELAGMINSALWSDFDGDGWVDLILAVDWGPLRMFKNNKGQLEDITDQMGISETLGWWHGLAAGDFDGDGDLDYVATNQGLNTKYHCSPDRPHRLYYKDFDENGTLDLVEAEFEDETEYPMRGRSCSSRSMPFIADKFDTYHEFALAPIAEIYDSCADAPHLTVNDLRTSVFWNEGEDGFTVEALPKLAQISPSFGVAVQDFDANGHLDILLAQNFFGSQAETGYMDGGLGLLLLGDGKRSFRAVWPRESGIIVPDDATALTTVDLDRDGDFDAAFTSNNGPLRFFRNRTEGKNLVRRIEVLDGNGRVNVAGTHLTIKFEDGSQQAFEFSAGDSYLGQSANELIVHREISAVTVRWPDGSTSSQDSFDGDPTITMTKPGNASISEATSN